VWYLLKSLDIFGNQNIKCQMVSIKMANPSSSFTAAAPSSTDLSTAQAAKSVRPEILASIHGFLNGSTYREIIESSSQYNSGVVGERKSRLPYLDSQTGVAQADCFLWMKRTDRIPGQNHGQLYSYPAKKWKKKRRQYLINESYLQRARQAAREAETAGIEGGPQPGGSSLGQPGEPSQATGGGNSGQGGRSSTPSEGKEGILGRPESGPPDYSNDSRDTWGYDFDDGSDLPDAGELDDPESDYDDYEEYGSRKKKKRKDTPKRKRVEYTDAEKPFSCELCGARYKTRPGLSYHYAHSHQKEGVGLDEESGYTPPRTHGSHSSTPVASPSVGGSGHFPPPVNSSTGAKGSPVPPGTSNGTTTSNNANSTSSSTPPVDFGGNRPPGKPVASPNDYCDFCLGGAGENKGKNGEGPPKPEHLVSCSDCGRSAHPSCLQFTPNMIESVKKYRWQCIECKSCGLCGTSDNDDQLLFCDDCDRGYHMYCLKPPLSEPPEGSWSCHLCILEYHQDK